MSSPWSSSGEAPWPSEPAQFRGTNLLVFRALWAPAQQIDAGIVGTCCPRQAGPCVPQAKCHKCGFHCIPGPGAVSTASLQTRKQAQRGQTLVQATELKLGSDKARLMPLRTVATLAWQYVLQEPVASSWSRMTHCMVWDQPDICW